MKLRRACKIVVATETIVLDRYDLRSDTNTGERTECEKETGGKGTDQIDATKKTARPARMFIKKKKHR